MLPRCLIQLGQQPHAGSTTSIIVISVLQMGKLDQEVSDFVKVPKIGI